MSWGGAISGLFTFSGITNGSKALEVFVREDAVVLCEQRGPMVLSESFVNKWGVIV